MKSDFIEFIGNTRQRKNEKFRFQFTVFLICLALSIFLWALVRLSKDYYYKVEYRLSFSSVPKNLNLRSVSDSILLLKVKIQGFEFFSEEFLIRQDRRFDVNLHNLKVTYGGEFPSGYLLTSKIGKEIVSQTSFPSDLYIVSPDTIFFTFTKPAGRVQINRMDKKPPNLIRLDPDKNSADSVIRSNTRKAK